MTPTPNSVPKPRDPARPSTSPEELAERVSEILAEPVSAPDEEVAQLEAAHRVLSDALSQN